MQASSWSALVRRIPADHHNNLVVVIATGGEIMVQDVLRQEDEYFIVRGRMSGSTDSGKVMIIPYDQICNLAFHKPMAETEVTRIFGEARPAAEPGLPAEAPPEVEPAAAAPEVPPPPGEPATPAPAVPKVAGQPLVPSKSFLLARLRARLAEKKDQP